MTANTSPRALSAVGGVVDAVAREQRLLEAIFQRDQATMSALMSVEGFGLDASMGLVRQTELIAAIDALSLDADFVLEDIRVLPCGFDVVALTYRLRQSGFFGGVPLPSVVYCTSVWQCRDSKWVAAFHHETPASHPLAAQPRPRGCASR